MKDKRYQIKKEPEVINVPIKEVHASINNKTRFLLVSLSLGIKNNYPDSRLPNVTVDAVEDICGCKRTDACFLTKLAKENNYYFNYDKETNSLTAKSLRRKHTKPKTNKKGETSWCVPVISLKRFKINKETGEKEKIRFTRQYLKEELTKQLQLIEIQKLEQKELQKQKRKNKYIYVYDRNLSNTPHKKCSKQTGAEKQRNYRLRRKLKEEGRIVRTRLGNLDYLSNYRSDGNKAVEQKRKEFHSTIVNKHGSVFHPIYCPFRTTRQKYDGARHIITNHEGRMTNYSKQRGNGKHDFLDCLHDAYDR